MGCYDGTEIYELVGTYIQNKYYKLMNKKDFGLYRDYGLGISRNTSGPDADRKRKNVIKIFKECGLSVTIEVNEKIIDFLDVCFNLNGETYKLNRKPNNDPVSIKKQSIDPPNITADVPKGISKCLTNISCNKNVFDRNIDIYQTALKISGFDETITYNDQSEQANNVNIEEANQARKRKRAIIWYNPSYFMNMKTKIGKTFFKLLQKHCPPTHPLYIIFNKSYIKHSYSFFPNMGSMISSHIKHILNSSSAEYGHNCNNIEKYPLENKY